MITRSGPRTSAVGLFRLDRCRNGSIIQFGDAACIDSESMVYTVMRSGSRGATLHAANFPPFGWGVEPLPAPVPVPESVKMALVHTSSSILVDRVDILSASASAIVQIGSARLVNCRSRTKSVREL